MKLLKFNFLTKIFLIFILLSIITLSTQYYGSTDIGDYSDTAKFFAGKNVADIRSSHSYLYGFVHSFFLRIFDSFIIFKITSLIFLLLIMLSVYYISNKDKKVFWMILLSPAIWYMAPWINPIQLSSLFFLWAWYFIRRYSVNNNLKNLFLSGLFVGLSWAFWDTALFFGLFLFIAFMFDKKLTYCVFFILAIFVGLLPRLLLDQIYAGSAFFSILKSTFGTFTNALFLGRGSSYTSSLLKNFITLGLIFLSFPVLFWRNYKKSFFIKNFRTMIFLSLSITLIFINPQIRYTLILVPIMIVLASKDLDDFLFKRQIKFSLIIIALFIFPTIMQMGYYFNESEYSDITYVLTNLPDISISAFPDSYYLKKDLISLSKDYPDSVFIVGNKDDYYQKLAHIYWGEDIKELVSIQDYNLWLKNESVIFEKKFEIIPPPGDRRAIWISGGISRNVNDLTDYSAIKYGISLDSTFKVEGFYNIENYSRLTLWEKR